MRRSKQTTRLRDEQAARLRAEQGEAAQRARRQAAARPDTLQAQWGQRGPGRSLFGQSVDRFPQGVGPLAQTGRRQHINTTGRQPHTIKWWQK